MLHGNGLLMKREQAITATLAAPPGLLLAGTAYLTAQAKSAEAV